MGDYDLGVPSIVPYNMGYKLNWDDGVEVIVDKIITKTDFTVWGFITVKDSHQLDSHLLGPIRNNITSTWNAIIKELEANASGRNWADRLKQVTFFVMQEHERGEPIVKLNEMSAPETPTERITGIAYEGMPTLIFGDGGMGKSTLAIALLTMVQAGKPLGESFQVVQGNVLVLDYEASAEEAWRRNNAVVAGMNLDRDAMIHYRFCTSPLATEVEHLKAEIREKNIDVVLVDSAGPACGGEPENAQACLQYFNALRSLGSTEKPITTITLAHITKGTGGKSGPFGSVYWTNMPRNTFELKKAQKRGENYIDLALHHRKTNTATLQDPVGLRMTWGDGISISAFKVADHAVLSEDLRVGERVFTVLSKEKTGMTIKEIAEYLNITQIDKMTAEMRQDDRFQVDDEGYWSVSDKMRF